MASFTKLSSKGQIVIPRKIRERLKLKSGQPFSVSEKNGKIVLDRLTAMEEFDKVAEPFRKAAKEIGFTHEDMMNLIKQVRKEHARRP